MSCLMLVLQVWGCAWSAAAQESCIALLHSVDIPERNDINTVKHCGVENVLIFFWEGENTLTLRLDSKLEIN